MPTETELQAPPQSEQQTTSGPETHQTQAQPLSSQQQPLNTTPQTTPSTGSMPSTAGGMSSTGSSSSMGTSAGTSSSTSSPAPGTYRSPSGVSRRGPSPASMLGDPLSMVRSFMNQMDRVFDDFMGRGGRQDLPHLSSASSLPQTPSQGQSMGFWYPQVEVSEKGGNLVVCADLPGINKEDVRLEVRDDYLILEGERRNQREESQEGGWYRSERMYGRFFRTVPLPEGVDPDQVRASFKDGVLEVTVPMPQREERQGRQIEIQ